MSRRFNTDSFRKRMKTVRKKLSPSPSEAKPVRTQPNETQHDEVQSSGSQSAVVRPTVTRLDGSQLNGELQSSSPSERTPCSSSDMSSDTYLNIARLKTCGHPALDRFEAAGHHARVHSYGRPQGRRIDSVFGPNSDESPSGPSGTNRLDRVVLRSQKPASKDRASSAGSGTGNVNLAPVDLGEIPKVPFHISPEEKAELEGYGFRLYELDDDLSNMMNSQLYSSFKKFKEERVKMAQAGVPIPEAPKPLPGTLTSFGFNDAHSDCSGLTDKDPVDDYKFKRWSDHALECQRIVIKRYNNGDKLWTKEGLLRLEDQIKGDDIHVRIQAYTGNGQAVLKDRNLAESKIVAKFHGYEELSSPPATRSDNDPYTTTSIKTVKYDHDDNLAESDNWLWQNCYKRIWKGNPIAYMLYAMFTKLPLPPIDKIVCFDLGPVAVRWNEPSIKTSRGIYRHLSALTIRDCLQKRFGITIRLLSQDPAYHPDCVRILTEKGFEIVGTHGAAGLAEIDERTLVFAPNPSFCLKEIVADIAEPAAMLWNTVLTPEEFFAKTKAKIPDQLNDNNMTCFSHRHIADPDSPRVRELIRNYDKHFFPENNLFGKISLYTRRAGTHRPSIPSPSSEPKLKPKPKVATPAQVKDYINATTQTELVPEIEVDRAKFTLSRQNGHVNVRPPQRRRGAYEVELVRGKLREKGKGKDKGKEKEESVAEIKVGDAGGVSQNEVFRFID